jgi:hypothetical protein
MHAVPSMTSDEKRANSFRVATRASWLLMKSRSLAPYRGEVGATLIGLAQGQRVFVWHSEGDARCDPSHLSLRTPNR